MKIKQNYILTKESINMITAMFLGLFLGAIIGWTHSYIYYYSVDSKPTEQVIIIKDFFNEPLVTPLELPQPVIKPVKPPRYGFTDDEIYLMSVLLTGSKDVGGDGEFDIDFRKTIDYEQVYLVLCVVMNRVQSPKFPNTVSEVIWQQGQFSPMPQWKRKLPQPSENSIKVVTEWCKAYDSWDDSVQTIPKIHLYFHGDGIKNYSR